MMLRIMMMLGISMTIGSALLAYEANRQLRQNPHAPLDFVTLMGGLQGQVVDLMQPAPKRDARQASLPQIRRGPATQMVTAKGGSGNDGCSSMSNQEQIDALVNSSPQLQALKKMDEQASRDSFWNRVKRKVTGDTKPGARLSDLRQRNAPPAPPKYSMDDIADMSPGEIMSNMGEIQRSIQGQAAQNIGAMKFD